MDGNLQFFTHTVGFELKWFFTRGPVDKFLTVWIVINTCVILVVAIGFYFLFRYLYGELVRYVLGNFQNSN